MNGHSASKTRLLRAARNTADTPAAGSGKRERILDAAERVFAQMGFYNAKVSDIAGVAQVADGTIYLYFKSKDDLLISLFEDRMEVINQNLQAALGAPGPVLARLRELIRLHLLWVEEHPAMAEVICVELRQSAKFMKEYANPKFAEYLRAIAEVIAEGQKRAEIKASLDPQLMARALFGALDEIATQWLMKGQQKKTLLPEASEQLACLFLDGISETKGAKS